MKLVSQIAIIINILVIFLLTACIFCVKSENKKFKESLGFVMGITTCFYLLVMSIIAVLGTIKHNYLSLIFLLFVIAPFVIGHFSRYEKMITYSIIQVLTYVVSLGLLFFIF